MTPPGDVMVDLETGVTYRPIEGTFISEEGETLSPGYIEFIGLQHFQDFIGNPGFPGTAVRHACLEHLLRLLFRRH